jgi:hypothetical protein
VPVINAGKWVQHESPKQDQQDLLSKQKNLSKFEGAIAVYRENRFFAKVQLSQFSANESHVHAKVSLLLDYVGDCPLRFEASWFVFSSWKFAPKSDIWSVPHIGLFIYFDPTFLAAIDNFHAGLSPDLPIDERRIALMEWFY